MIASRVERSLRLTAAGMRYYFYQNVMGSVPWNPRSRKKAKPRLHPDGSVVLLPKLPVTALRGMLKYPRPPATVEDMDEAVITGANEGVLRGRRR